MKTKYLFLKTITLSLLFAQEEGVISEISSDYTISSERYQTDSDGNIMMYVNIWGAVPVPGRKLVYDGIDMATLLSMVGGPRQGANMSRVQLFREVPDSNNKLSYEIDLTPFIISGDRSSFVKIKPNDTILIHRTTTSLIIEQVGTFNTILSLFNLYFIIRQSF